MNKILQSVSTCLFATIIVLGALPDLAAQSVSIRGVITSNGETLPGVNVVEKSSGMGTVSDIDGNFSLEVLPNSVLIFSAIGLKTLEINVGNRTYLEIEMEDDIAELSEVVVIGFGSIDRRDLTNPVSSVSSKQLKDIPINSASEALTGRLAGVQITTTEGSPNADVQIRVRGGGSITQDNNPIYVVDGIQVENALSVLSPQDIESIDVLKDASATAIYGARGANGVVIITTKGGKAGKTTVNYSGFAGVRRLANTLDVMDPYEFVKYQYERSRGSQADRNNFANMYGNFSDLENYRRVPFQDWQNETFGGDAIMRTDNLSVTGGNATTQFNISLTSNKEEGIMLNSDWDRKLASFRFDHKVSDKLKVGFNLRYNNQVINGAGTSASGSFSSNRLRHSVKYRPIVFPGQEVDEYDPDYANETNANSLALINPLLLAEAEYQQDRRELFNMSAFVAYEFTDYLNFRSTAGFDRNLRQVDVFNDSITNVSRLVGASLPLVSIRNNNSSVMNWSNVVNFQLHKLWNAFGEKNSLDVLIGQEVWMRNVDDMFIESRFFPSGVSPQLALNNLSLGTPQIPTSNFQEERILSFFSRVNFARDDKYLAMVTVRADGSSKFAQGQKWGVFPSAAVAWRLSSEDFMSWMSSGVSDMKLRFSMGTSGNNKIPNFLYLPQFVAGGTGATNNANYTINNNLITAFRPADLANSNLRWETTLSRNLGVDVAFFDNRLQFTADLYRNDTYDLLIRMDVPSISGYSTQFQNVGNTSNQGLEFQINAFPVSTKDFNWNVNFNMSFNQNKIESLGGVQDFILFNSGWAGSNSPADFAIQVGQSMGTIWGLQTDGFYTLDDFTYDPVSGNYILNEGVPNNQSITSLAPQPGVLKFKDISGPDGVPDGIVDDHDRGIIGNTMPKFFGGINQQFTYKGWDLSVFFNFQYGNQVYNANKLEFSSGYTPNSNMLSIMEGRWTNIDGNGNVVTDPDGLAALNENATIWSPLRTASSFYPHSWAIEDGSFIRLNNLSIGYTLPRELLQKVRINNLRIYATGNNLAIWTRYSGYDPEVSTRRSTPVTPGVDYAAYPRSKAYIMGINMSF